MRNVLATPKSKRRLDDSSLQSTPQSTGTASRAEFIRDTNTNSPDNILLVEDDLNGKSTTYIVHFLMAILGRIILEQKGNVLGQETSFHKEITTERDLIFKEMLTDAVSFCNRKEGKNWDDLITHLNDYCRRPYEADRYLPLSNALNAILSEFGDKPYGSLPRPDLRDDKEELIFMPNDPNVIQALHLWDVTARKPDVIGVHLSHLREIYKDFEHCTYEEMSKHISASDVKDKVASRKSEWADILQTWELKVKDKKLDFPTASNEFKWSTHDIMNLMDLTHEVAEAGLKRSCSDSAIDVPVPKRSCGGRSATQNVHIDIRPENTPPAPPKPKVDPDVQCAYYGLERLSGLWTIMHSTVILLEDKFLSLRWFDAQGCIECVPFDFLDQLPIFITMTVMFQRFNPYMWGVSQSDPSKATVGGRRFELGYAPTKFQLNGRRTAGAFAEPIDSLGSTSPQSEQSKLYVTDPEKNFYFKSAWVEGVRAKEYDIIDESRRRSEKHLPETYQRMITTHIPQVFASQVCISESTAVIRFFLDQAKDPEHVLGDSVRKGTRVRVWMVTPRHLAVHGLNPRDFWRVFWDSVRCHYLLWKVGIAHSDISLLNMMCTLEDGQYVGKLNDFDLAAIMKPGARCPERLGWERTGTIAFMAMDLLKYNDGTLKRWYRHDLESFFWCLVWEVMADPPVSWTESGFNAVSQQKSQFFSDAIRQLGAFNTGWGFTERFIRNWMRMINGRSTSTSQKVEDALFERKTVRVLPEAIIALQNAEDEMEEDSEHIRSVVQRVRSLMPVTDVPALVDISWIDVKINSDDE